MKIGFRTIGFRDQPVEETLRTLAEIGYHCVELCLESPDLQPRHLTPSRIRQIKSLLEDLGLCLSAVSYHGLQDQLEVRRQNTYRALEITAQFSAPALIVASRNEEPPRLRAQWMEHIDWYRELCTLAEPEGFKIAVEPQPGLVVRNAEDLVKMIQEVKHEALAANLDVAHAALTADDLSWAIYTLGPRLVHVHLADVRGQEHQHLLPGTGQLDWGELYEIFEAVGYQGPYVIDLPRLTGNPTEIAGQALAALRERWPLEV